MGNSVLLVIDMQKDFLPGGALAVPDGDSIIPGINKAIEYFIDRGDYVIFTQDWHPPDHLSFASAHEGKKPGDPIKAEGLGPVLWPDHCVIGTEGAEIHEDLNIDAAVMILRKGYRKNIDSYSAFFENDGKTKTGLAGFLKDLGVKNVYICGLATDYCCYFSAVDAAAEGFSVYFLEDLTRGIDIPENNIKNALADMKNKGIKIIRFDTMNKK